MAKLIDCMHLGRDRVIGAYELDGLIVDPGPSSCLAALLEGVEGEPRALLLTHIHLDHAGAAGSLVARFPKLRVYVHDRARGGDRERFLAEREAEIDVGVDAGVAERLRQAAPPEQLWLGLERYWRKRA